VSFQEAHWKRFPCSKKSASGLGRRKVSLSPSFSVDHSANCHTWMGRNSASRQSCVLLLSPLYDPEGDWFKNLWGFKALPMLYQEVFHRDLNCSLRTVSQTWEIMFHTLHHNQPSILLILKVWFSK
jgi:hypothetical protein